MPVQSKSNLNLELGVGFWREGKPEYPEKDFSEQEKEPEINETQAWNEFTG